MIEKETRCTFTTDQQFYITGEFGGDGNAPHNFVLVNGIKIEGTLIYRNLYRGIYISQSKRYNSFYWNSEFQNQMETTVIINISTAELKIQFSGPPDITKNGSPNYEHTSLLILQNNQQTIYNTFNHSSKHICSYWL